MSTKKNSNRHRLSIVAETPLLRTIIRKAISMANPDLVLSEIPDAGSLLDNLRQKEFDVIILVFETAAGLGLDLLKQVKAVQPEVAIIVINFFPADHEALSILRAQADAYLGHKATEKQLQEALSRVIRGKRFISPRVAEKLVYQLSSVSEFEREPSLSSRENEVLALIARGKKRAEIADILCLSPQTISSYRSRILEKLGVKNNAELIRYAVENDLV